MLRYLNMFVLIGIALIAISCVGFATGSKTLTEPGQATNPNAALIYLGAGVLMLINGYLSLRHAPSAPVHPQKSEAREQESDGTDPVQTTVRS